MKKDFLGFSIDVVPHKIVRELVGFMLEINNPLSIEQLTHNLSKNNTTSNLSSRIKRCLTNTPDVVNERPSEQSRKFSIPLHYKNIEVIQEGDKFSLKLSHGNSPEVRESDYTNEDLQEFMNTKKEWQNNSTDKSKNQELYKLKEDFLKEWSIERLKSMTIEEYTNLDKTSFCYWLEAVTTDVGSIWGGSAYKFGIFKRKELESENYNDKRKSDGEYAWYGKYGDTRQEAYDKVKETVINIAALSQQNKLEQVEQIDFGNGIKWKIAFLYGDYNIINIFNHNALKTSARYLEYEGKDQSYPALNKYILSQKGGKDYFDFTQELWSVFYSLNLIKAEFEKWLKSKKDADSAKVSLFIKAIDILISNFKIDIYTEDEVEVLEELCEDLKLNQKDENGKYYYSKAKSYGNGGFYSAAVGAYLEFLGERNIEDIDSSDEERLIRLLKEIGQHDSEKFYSLMEHILSELSIDVDDERICYSLPKNKRIGLTIGQKLCSVIERKKGRNRFRYFDTTKNEKDWLKEVNSIEAMSDVLNTIILSATNELAKTDKTGYGSHSSISLEKSLFNDDYKKNIFQKAFNKDIKTDNMSTDLNQIFFGPPGTGKTYHTINEAIKIVDPEFYKLNHDKRDKLKERFRLLLLNNDNENLGQIGFTTFHQSFSYEDFIEGIKPIEPKDGDTFLKYKIQEGIFKKVCRLANDSLDSLISLSQEVYDKSHFYKMSLGNSQSDIDSEIYDYCIQNNCIALGLGDGHNYNGKDEKAIKDFGTEKGLDRLSITAINQFKVLLKIDDYVIISNGGFYVRAIGKVVGEYEFIKESPFENNPTYKQFRKVEWIFTDKQIEATEIYNKNLLQQTIYQLIKNEIKQEFFVKEKKVDILKLPKNPKNFVLIVDEINRGNVSSIFGELITLIEKDKRKGTDEELSVILPYSKKEFKVPHNVYIIGTMNTADRSIEALDTALRRRFSFREMPPKPSLILTEGRLKDSKGMIGDINVVEILKTINDRIEKLVDKDHKIGHSYFLNIKTEAELKDVFKNKVIPLLEEYFFGDFGKIGLVLGNSFITKTGKEDVEFAEFDEYDSSIRNDLMERSVYEITSDDIWDFESVYSKSTN
jgi:5-methylcytosine-specific restriction endonuclease McrBC GTP-binding regulatory subunit McrB